MHMFINIFDFMFSIFKLHDIDMVIFSILPKVSSKGMENVLLALSVLIASLETN